MVEVAGWTLSHALDTRALLEFREAVELWDAGGMAGDFSPERIYAILLASSRFYCSPVTLARWSRRAYLAG